MKDIESPDYRYNTWAGNPKGEKQNPERCVAEVSSKFLYYQCRRKRAIGLYCKQHAKEQNK